MFLSWIGNRNNSGTRIPLLFQVGEQQRLFLVSSTNVSRFWERSSKPESMTGEVSVTHTAWVWELKMPSVSIVPGCRVLPKQAPMSVGLQMDFVVASGQAAALMAVLPSQGRISGFQGAVGTVA